MENKTTILIAVLVTAVICIAGTYVAVGGTGEKNSGAAITVTGSTTVQPLMVEFQEEFDRYSDMVINVTGGGSGAGVSAAQNGTADIGMLSRDLKPSETGLTPVIIAKDGVIVVVDRDAGITDMTLEQLAKIYSGQYSNWKQIGGSDMPINPIIREEGSGTRDCIDTLMATVPGFSTDNFNKYSTQASTGAMLSQIKNVNGAIGYVNLGSLSDADGSSVTAVSMDGVKATPESVLDGSYELSRNLILVTKGEPGGSAAFFINWILSKQGQAIVEDKGFVPVSSAS
ncbi:MAG: phosphate ABC transporter substrate-binding protein [Candidatus Methanoplasma sp.]|nr:phosphate ABC transporter substrate-binding protein [Candidatus Methanoplasma sp.]